ncbi:MAG: GGDEF domain-containing protein, partial [Candidatus Omnitrophica bacterium]|nr:GGDEF domain-containing protein [Candidatus Omnitrophota bacterium]
EFSIILPAATQEKATKFAEKLRQHIEAYEFQGQDIQPHHNLTVSIGVCGYPENAENKGELIYRADMALYQAKRGGRNRIRAYRS